MSNILIFNTCWAGVDFKSSLFALLFFIVLPFSGFSQRTLPNGIFLKTPGGEIVSLDSSVKGNVPIVMVLWETFCRPSQVELNTLQENLENWQEESGVKVIAVSVDDTRSSAKVGPIANANGWEFEILLDENGNLKRALNVNACPFTVILNSQREIVWEKTSWQAGLEEELYKAIVNAKY